MAILFFSGTHLYGVNYLLVKSGVLDENGPMFKLGDSSLNLSCIRWLLLGEVKWLSGNSDNWEGCRCNVFCISSTLDDGGNRDCRYENGEIDWEKRFGSLGKTTCGRIGCGYLLPISTLF